MIKAIRKVRILTLIIFAAQILVMGAAAFFYLYPISGWTNQADFFTIDYLLILFAVLVLGDILFVWLALNYLYGYRQKQNLGAAEIVSRDVKEAYHFGMLGLVVVDDNEDVIWASELFTERQINILDQNIKKWQPALTRLIDINQNSATPESDDIVKIAINARNYDVKYLSDARLFIFKDTTDIEHLYRSNTDQSAFVGVVMIDNFTDLNAKRESSNPVIALITSAVYEYGKKYGVLVRRYRDDAFLLLGNYASFAKMESDRFTLLETVRSMEINQNAPFTLSIGLAYNFPDIVKLNDMALKAIDLAMTRGGDQLVIAKYGAEYQYFGGVAVAGEKRNKVKVRVTADTLSNLVRNAGNVLIMAHKVADLDAIGGALGVKAIVDYIKQKEAGNGGDFTPARIVFDPANTESKTRFAIAESFSKEVADKTFITSKEVLSDKYIIKPNSLLIVVDVSRPTQVMSEPILELFSNVAVIDHHRRAEDFIVNPVFQYIESGSSSTSELITELIEYGNFPEFKLNPAYATMMLAGIFLDTNYFRNNATGMRTFEACMVLKDFGADNGMADEFLKDEYEEYALKTKIMATLKTPFFGVVYAKADPKDSVDSPTLAKVANQCIQIKGVSAAFVIGATGEKEVSVSARSDGTINVQILMEKLGGGGHQASAAVQIANTTVEKVEGRLMQTLNLFLNDARVVEKK